MVGGDSDKGHTITGGHQGPIVTDCVFVRDTISHLLWVGKAPLSGLKSATAAELAETPSTAHGLLSSAPALCEDHTAVHGRSGAQRSRKEAKKGRV